jgi:hypothetical protein
MEKVGGRRGSSKCTPRYYRLVIIAKSRHTKIWLGDDEGHLVQAETGILDTSLLRGRYVVEFGLGTTTYPIHLTKDSEYKEGEITAGPSCPRPEVKIDPD